MEKRARRINFAIEGGWYSMVLPCAHKHNHSQERIHHVAALISCDDKVWQGCRWVTMGFIP
ncbi:conserved hypothetical protein [Ricinus communis]|uniref:Uncharacterized protein n=1 Tax=Ricinus communis TaxID=3988 RepID=B9SV38_RICCO|nr:conserved hypothetical protein [Ricinus communis]